MLKENIKKDRNQHMHIYYKYTTIHILASRSLASRRHGQQHYSRYASSGIRTGWVPGRTLSSTQQN